MNSITRLGGPLSFSFIFTSVRRVKILITTRAVLPDYSCFFSIDNFGPFFLVTIGGVLLVAASLLLGLAFLLFLSFGLDSPGSTTETKKTRDLG